MRGVPLALLFISIIFLFPQHLFAGAALVQVQQAKQMRARAQAQAQYEAQAQAMQQQAAMQQGAEVQAAQEYMAQQQMIYTQQQIAAYIAQQQNKQIEEALVYRYVQQELARQMAQAQVQQVQQLQQNVMQQTIAQGVQQAVYQRNLASQDTQAAREYLQMRNEAIAHYQAQVGQALIQANARQQQEVAVGQVVAANAVYQKQYEQAVAQQLGATAFIAGMTKPYEHVPAQHVKQIVSIGQVWNKLDQKSNAWALLIDNQAKYMTVQEYIDRFRRENVKIHQPASYYANMIDGMSSQQQAMLDRPFKELLQILAVMEYDFDNGSDRDMLAQKILGQEFYLSNKQRLGK